jgi:hypothetical protein
MPKVHSDPKQCYETPQHVLDRVRAVGKIGFDPCTADDNPTKAALFFTASNPAPPPDKWPKLGAFEVCFVNPPYADNASWLAAILEYDQPTICLWNASVGTRWWNQAIETCYDFVFWGKRISYVNPATKTPVRGNNFGSALFLFHPTVYITAKWEATFQSKIAL